MKPESSSGSVKKYSNSIRSWLRIGASIALLILCLSLVDPAVFVQTITQMQPEYVLSAFGLNLIGTVLVRAWVARMTTRASGLLLSFEELVRINLVARFYTIALPRGASAAIRWQWYRKGGSGHAAAALLMFENLVSVFTLFTSAAIILLIESTYTDGMGQILLPVAWLGTLFSTIVLLPFIHKPSAVLARRLLQPLLKRPGRLSSLVERLYAAVIDYQSISVRQICVIFFASALGYIFFVLSAWVLAEGMVLDLSFTAIAWIRSVTLLLALMPVTVAGIGLREGAFIVLLREYGISTSTAFAYAVALFAIQIMLGLLGAVLEMSRVLIGGRRSGEKSSRDIL